MKKQSNAKINKKKRNAMKQSAAKKKRIATLLVSAIITVALLFWAGTRISSLRTGSVSTEPGVYGMNDRKPQIVDQDLIIRIDELSENALFFPMLVDGYNMEVLAVIAPDGTIRTAFNACQVCYPSGRGYYVQVGSVLVCQNCNMRYQMSMLEREVGGCNPVPIFPANKVQTNETITISLAHIRETKSIFQSWR